MGSTLRAGKSYTGHLHAREAKNPVSAQFMRPSTSKS